MEKGKKSESSLRGLQKKIIKRKSLSNSRESYQSNVKNVGLRGGVSDNQSNILLYDIYTCPLSIYIDVTCDDSKLNKLVIQGNPTQEQLEDARFKLVTDFSELSNNGESKAISDVITNLYYQRNILLGYEISLKLVLTGKFSESIAYLNNHGLKCEVPKTEDEHKKLINAMQLKIKNRLAKYKEARSQYDVFYSGKTERPTRAYYNKLIVMLSMCEIIKIQLNIQELTAAQFAEYLNVYNEYQNQLKIKNNGKR